MRIIYIAGTSHSGSTLLNLILGTSNNAFSIGELNLLERYMHTNLVKDRYCDCGKIITKCHFWKDIIQKTDIDKLLPYKRYWYHYIILLQRILVDFRKKEGEEERLYQRIFDKARTLRKDIDVLIDSSKGVKHLFNIFMMRQVKLQIIHLVRDGRGVVNSNEKNGAFWLANLFRWIAGNKLIHLFLLLRINKRDYMRIGYDEFVKRPDDYIRMINTKFGLNIPTETYANMINKIEYHNFSGNPMRKKRFDGIRHDESWKKRFPAYKKAILSIITYIPNKAWVYRKSIQP